MSSAVIAQLRSQSSSVNLSALQQRDAQVARVLFTAKHVVLYHLDQAQAWQRQDIEGPLFIVERRTVPYYQLVILNRKSITDWRQPLTTAMASAIETQDKSERTENKAEMTGGAHARKLDALSPICSRCFISHVIVCCCTDIFSSRPTIW